MKKGHTDTNGSQPYIELSTLGPAAVLHLLAGSGNTAPYVIGIGVDHGTTTGLVASVKDAGTGVGATLETDATNAARGFFGQVFSAGRLMDLVQGTGSGAPMLNLRNPFGGTRNMSKTEAGSYFERVTADGSRIAWFGDEASPNYYTIERLTGAKWDKIILAKASSTQYFGTRLFANANHFRIQKSVVTGLDVDAATWSTLIDLQDTNLIGFFGATPVSRRAAIPPVTDAATSQTASEALRVGMTALGLFN